MDFAPLPEMIDGLPNICGAEAQVEEVTRGRAAGVPARDQSAARSPAAACSPSPCTCSSR